MKSIGRTLKPIAIFLGPSLRKDHACALLNGDYYPPARRGDVYRLIASGVKTIILIDGVFHTTPSVWQRELLQAIDEGIQVLGASSMGALRAAELHQLGMMGYGTIFEWYRDGIIDGDDEVALWHESEESDFRPLSEPLVNIRCTLLRAVEHHCIPLERAEELIAYAKQLHYPNRSYRQLLNSPVVKGWSQNQMARLERYFSTKSVDLKRLDAIGVLQYCACMDVCQARSKARTVHSPFRGSDSWHWDYARMCLGGFLNSRGVVSAGQVLNEACKDSALVETMRPILSKRYFTLEWARQNGVFCPEDFVRTFIKRWEEEHGINEPAWLEANGLTQRTYEMLCAESALIHWVTTQGETRFGLKRSFVLEWAEQNGVSCSFNDSVAPTEAVLEEWIIKQGPHYFGLDWNFEAALLRELQVTGRAADLIEQVQAK